MGKVNMNTQTKRYTNLQEFNQQSMSRIKIDEDKFEVILAEIEEDDRIDDDQVKFLQEEDEIIQALHVCSSKSFMDFIPTKTKNQLMDELSEEGLIKIDDDKIKFFCKKTQNQKS